MTQVSRIPISKSIYERIFNIFTKTIASCKRKDQVALFLREFLTPTEQIMLAKRLSIAFLLLKNYNYLEISSILRVSTCTVRNVSVNLKNNRNLVSKIEKIMEDEKVEKFLEDVGEKVAKIFATSGSKSGAWKHLEKELGNRKKKKVF